LPQRPSIHCSSGALKNAREVKVAFLPKNKKPQWPSLRKRITDFKYTPQPKRCQ
jgi:hypothetical protein